MAVVSFDRIHTGRAAEESVDGSNRFVRRYTDEYRAITDSNYTEPEEVLADVRCPRVGQPLFRDPRAYCRSINPENDGDSKRIYIVTVSYSSEFEMEEDPTAEPARITWHTAQYQIPVVFDRNKVPHLNTARDWFDPPAVMDDSRWCITIQKNLAAVPTWILSCPNAVNDADVTIDGVLISRGFLRVSEIEIGESQQRNDVAFRTVTITLQLKTLGGKLDKLLQWDDATKEYVSIPDADTWHAHAIITTNVGLRHYPGGVSGGLGPVDCLDKDDKQATAPMLLADNGAQLPFPVQPEDATFVVSDVYPEMDFSLLPLS